MSVFYLREELKEKENLKEQGIPRTISLFEQPFQDGQLFLYVQYTLVNKNLEKEMKEKTHPLFYAKLTNLELE